jgi:hypothetical protein
VGHEEEQAGRQAGRQAAASRAGGGSLGRGAKQVSPVPAVPLTHVCLQSGAATVAALWLASTQPGTEAWLSFCTSCALAWMGWKASSDW